MSGARPLTIAVPKGRILEALAPLLTRAGIDPSPLLAKDRKLMRPSADGGLLWLFLKPDDVPTFVEYGAADLGIAGRDTLLEREPDVYAPVDLGIGRCKLAVAAPRAATSSGNPEGGFPKPLRLPELPRIASKYPRIAASHFARKGVQAEVIAVHGSVELAPLVGLADAIVDIVETGTTLRENDLEVIEDVAEVSTVLIANRAAYKLEAAPIRRFVGQLRAAL